MNFSNDLHFCASSFVSVCDSGYTMSIPSIFIWFCQLKSNRIKTKKRVKRENIRTQTVIVDGKFCNCSYWSITIITVMLTSRRQTRLFYCCCKIKDASNSTRFRLCFGGKSGRPWMLVFNSWNTCSELCITFFPLLSSRLACLSCACDSTNRFVLTVFFLLYHFQTNYQNRSTCSNGLSHWGKKKPHACV